MPRAAPSSAPRRSPVGSPASRLLARLSAAGQVIRRVIGVPDYDRYLAHARTHHPGCQVLSREAFTRERMEARYSRPGSRCC